MTRLALPIHEVNRINLEEHGLRPEFPEVLDSSMVKDFMYCPSYFYLRHVLGLRKKHYDIHEDAGRDWGTVWHSVMEAYHNALEYLPLHEATIKGLEQLDPWPDSIKPEIDKHARSKDRMIMIFFDYVEKFGESDQADFDLIRTEQFFDQYLDEFGIRWAGRIDRVVRRKKNNRIMLWDYKTTSYMMKFYFEQFEHSFQMPGYVKILSNILTEPVREVHLDVLYTLKGSHDFFRRTIPYTPEKLAEWGRNTRNILDYMYWLRDNHLHNPEAWAKNWNHCTSWNRACTFADVHWTNPSPSTRLKILRDDYIVERWDPSREETE